MSSSKEIVFFVRAFNDLDHFSPVAYIYLQNNVKVRFLLTDTSIGEDDFRIRLLSISSLFSVRRFHLVDLIVLKRVKILEKFYSRFCLDGGLVRNLTGTIGFFLFAPLLMALYKRNIGLASTIFVDWSTPYSRGLVQWWMLFYHRLRRRQIIAIPHGVNIYINNDVTDSYHKLARVNPTVDYMRFDQRNWYNKYIVQYAEKAVAWCSLGGSRLISLGSPRFMEFWSEEIFKELASPSATVFKTNKLKILFFDHQKDYRIIKESILSLVKRIASEENVELVLRESTRRGKSYYTQDDIDQLKAEGVTFSNTNSVSLIHEADLVINFGSSIVFEAILQRKHVINPVFCHRNNTYVEQLVPSATALDESKVIEKIRQEKRGEAWFSLSEADELYKTIILDSRTNEEIIGRWLSLV